MRIENNEKKKKEEIMPTQHIFITQFPMLPNNISSHIKYIKVLLKSLLWVGQGDVTGRHT